MRTTFGALAVARVVALALLAVSIGGCSVIASISPSRPGTSLPKAAVTYVSDVKGLSLLPMSDRVLLTWKNPSEASLTGARIVHRVDRFPVESNDGELVADVPAAPNTSASYVHSGLVPKVTHYYTVFSHNASGQFSSGVQVSARTTFSYLAPKAARLPVLRQEYPYTNPQQLTDGVYGSDDPADPAWVEFSPVNVNPYFFGVDAYWGIYGSSLTRALEAGVQACRHTVNWGPYLETAKGVYDWPFLDSNMTASSNAGIKTHFLILGTPSWAAPFPNNPPTNLQDYADFAAALVRHVNSTFPNKSSKVIEVWNEINEWFWSGTMEEYLQMLKLTYLAVKAEDPSWRVMAETFSGMEIPEFDYLYQFKDENGDSYLQKYSDLIAVHTYGGLLSPDDPTAYWGNFSVLADNTQRIRDIKVPGTPWGWGQLQLISENDPSPNILRSWRQVMVKNGDGDKKLWITETAWEDSYFDGSNPSWPYSPDPKRVAELLTRLYEKSAEYDFVESVEYYSMDSLYGTNLIKSNALHAFQNLASTDGIVIDLSKSPTGFYPSPLLNIKRVKVGALNYAQGGQVFYRIQKIDVSISSDNITYTNVGQITNMGPNTGRVDLTLDNINQVGRWIKLQITPIQEANKVYLPDVEKASGLQTPQIPPSTVANSYLIDEVDVELGP